MFTMSAREFNQSVAKAQRVADDEPVLVTRHGEPAYVLLSVAEYQKLRPQAAGGGSLLELLAMSAEDLEHDDGEFDRIMAEIETDRKTDFGRPPIEF
ncbi:type II toxin-antitoxin system Phd/YefM family antitoxin [Microbacterium sp. KUDC0406]|uniref:type II toxin-antitoxin system Phd/YefM family antitoxin n=1 Tax=Microbacterium sp. KUDC0406 TaxID=2909588 RepID=UPI001F41F6AD|nr:type II toxin-antitoxin system prevent-host-death family antitoxin [Microbacterium sp. KUDC0406]UJP10489.1 type II toxin-antitoxin system Phd/YefM family antitoxin [Microbacterium sp. KUDC0406]